MNTPSALVARLGARVPIFQAPIGAMASPALAAAVADAGGVGHLAGTWRSPADLAAAFHAMRDTRGAWGANFVLDFPVDDRLALALDQGVRIVSFFWGDASPFLGRVRAAGAFAMQVVGSVAEARRAADAGVDAIVAQGREAGGHVRGDIGTLALVPQVVDAVGAVPVLAAGGIADRRGVAAAVALGAAGVWVGTRFLAADEANAHPEYQARVLAASGDDTLYSGLFDGGWPDAPMRTLRNATTTAWEAAGSPAVPARPGEGDVVAQRADGSPLPRYHFAAPTREMRGDVGAMALYAGQAVGLVRAREPAARIVASLAAGLTSHPHGGDAA